jgi:enoyl-CoA hydratase/carnithine racemase
VANNKVLRIDDDGAVRLLTLDRPEAKNAFNRALYDGVRLALDEAADDDSIAVCVITGAGDIFSAGQDLKVLAGMKDNPEEAKGFDPFARALARFDKPLIAAVNGAAVGVGTTMLLHCDLVYAAPNARFQLPFVALGIVPEFGSTFLLPLVAGYQRAAELLLLGQPFTAQKAYEAGIVTEVVPQEKLLEHALQVASALAALPPESIRLTKRLMKTRHTETLAATIDEETRIFTERLHSPEAKEAMSAFLEKRKPDFSRF